jgi:exonuclease III
VTFNNLIPVQSLTYEPVIKNIKVGSLNACSVCNKADELSEFIDDEGLDICAITETWLSPGAKDVITLGNLTPTGYKVDHIPRHKGKGGGVAFVYKDMFSFIVQTGPKYSSFECIEALLSTGNDCIRFSCIYRPPPGGKSGKPTCQFLDDFTEYVDSHATTSGRLIITGDFNFHLEDSSNSDARKFNDLLISLNLTQHVTEPTHTHGHLLDLVLSRSSDSIISDLHVHGAPLSDHSPVSFSLPFHQSSTTEKTVHFRKLKEIDIEDFKSDIEKSSLYTNPAAEITDLVRQYNVILQEVLDRHAPLLEKKVRKRRHTEWYNEDIMLAKRARRRAENKWRKTKLSVHRDMYKSECIRVHVLVKSAKAKFYQDKIDQCGTDQKELFKVAKKLTHQDKAATLPTYHDAVELGDRFAEYFTLKIENIRKEFPTLKNQSSERKSVTNVSALDKFEPIKEDKLKKLIMASNSKSCHLDPIPTTLLKASIDVLLPVLCQIINCSIQTSTVPAGFKSATVKPLLKKPSLNKEDLKNYRPVSNLPYISKLTEKVIVQQLNDHMTSNNLHEPFQSAYRVHHSTETALLRVYNDIIESIDNKHCVMLVLLDLSAAFDTVDHAVLLNRFEDALGITGHALAWLQSYFDDRYQSVHIDKASSQKHHLKTGMPQGSVVGPFGFPSYSAPVGAICRRHGIQYHLYADDTQLYISFLPPDSPNTVKRLEACITEIRAWMRDNFLKLNDSKTSSLFLGLLTNFQKSLPYQSPLENWTSLPNLLHAILEPFLTAILL